MTFSILNMAFSDRLKQRMKIVGLNAAELAWFYAPTLGRLIRWIKHG